MAVSRVLGPLVAVVLAGLACTPPAHAHLPATVQTTVSPGGNSSLGSPTLDPGAKTMAVDIAPSTPADEQFFENMDVVLSLQPTPGKRLLLCIGLYINVAHGIDESVELQFPEQVHPLAVLLLSACLHQAAALNRAQQAASQQPSGRRRATSAAAQCGRLATQVGATFTKVGANYKATVSGKVSKAKQRGRLKVSCSRKGKGISLRVRPAAKGRSLRSVVGSRLRLGVYNPLEATGSGTLKVTFRR